MNCKLNIGTWFMLTEVEVEVEVEVEGCKLTGSGHVGNRDRDRSSTAGMRCAVVKRQDMGGI